MDSAVGVLELGLVEQSEAGDSESGFFEALPDGAVGGGLFRMALSPGKFRLPGKGSVRAADSNQDRLPALDDGNANSDHRSILGKWVNFAESSERRLRFSE
jgi:hypothetical protein